MIGPVRSRMVYPRAGPELLARRLNAPRVLNKTAQGKRVLAVRPGASAALGWIPHRVHAPQEQDNSRPAKDVSHRVVSGKPLERRIECLKQDFLITHALFRSLVDS